MVGLERKISKLILGTVQFGLNYGVNNTLGKVQESEVSRMLTIAKEKGVCLLDTAYSYGDSEEVLGSQNAHNFFKIVSKFPKCDKMVEEMFVESIKRLQTDSLYAYMVHDFDSIAKALAKWVEFEKLKEAKKVKKIGFSLYNVKQLEFLWDNNVDFDIVQFPYNIFDRQFEPFFSKLKEKNVEIHTRSVFLQGLFFKNTIELGNKHFTLKPYLDKLHLYCNKKNITVEQLTLNYVLSKDKIDGVLIGVDSVEQFQTNLSKLNYTISDEDIDFVDSIIIKEKRMLNPVNW